MCAVPVFVDCAPGTLNINFERACEAVGPRTRAIFVPHTMGSPWNLAALKAFAREKFGAKHRYAMALHTHQQHPHVHLVVKAEGHDGRRLHIDKARLRAERS